MLKIIPLFLLFFYQGVLMAQGPQITQPPVGQTVTEGQSAQFIVLATGTNLSYKWLKSGIPLIDAGRFSGTETATLTISGTLQSDAGSYSVAVAVSGSTDLKVSSEGVLLKVNPATPPAPQITQPPSGQTVIEGQGVQFSVVATGSNLIYQWLKEGSPLVNSARINGASSATLNIIGSQETDAGTYSVVVMISGFSELKVSSDGALLKVNLATPSAPVITQHPAGKTATLGNDAQFTVTATGANLVYQWARDGELLIDGDRVSGAGTAILTISETQITDRGLYSVIVREVDYPSLWSGSDSALLELVEPAPEIDIQQPKGSKLVDGKTKKSFGTVRVGKSGSFKTFTIKNIGTAKLSGLSVTKAGSHPNDFLVVKPLKVSLPTGEYTIFKISFKPTKRGDRTAWIRIKSNDSNENPFDIKLAGLGVAP